MTLKNLKAPSWHFPETLSMPGSLQKEPPSQGVHSFSFDNPSTGPYVPEGHLNCPIPVPTGQKWPEQQKKNIWSAVCNMCVVVGVVRILVGGWYRRPGGVKEQLLLL